MAKLPSHDEVLRSVGAALSNWSLIELQLSTLFAHISDVRDFDKAQALFAAIISFDARLAVCDRLMLLEKADEIELEMWAKMSARLSKFYKKRHELAHFSLHYDTKMMPVISPFLTNEKIIYDKVRNLTIDQIRERSRKFIELHRAVGWFTNEAFWRRSKSRPATEPDSEELPLVVQLRELAIQSLEERKQRGQSPQA